MSWVRNFTSSDAPFGAVEEAEMALTPLNRTKISKFYATSGNSVSYSCSVSPIHNVSVLSYNAVDIAAGWRNSSWRTMVRHGVQAGTPYTREITGVESNTMLDISYSQFANFGICTDDPRHTAQLRTDRYFNSMLSSLDIPAHGPSQLSRADNQAVARLRGEILAEYEHLNSLITLGELGSTVRQLTRPYEKMRSLVLSHLDGLHRKLSKISPRMKPRPKKIAIREALSSSWLETTLGVLPTISDTRSIAEALAHHVSGADLRRKSVKGYGEVVSSSLTAPAYGSLGGHARYWSNTQTTTTDKVVYRAGLEVKSSADSNPASSLLKLTGFQPLNFIPTVWEVIPFSWVVDYFVTIGQCLNLNVVNTGSVRWIVKSTVRETKRVKNSIPDSAYIPKTLGSQFAGQSGTPGKCVTFRRNAAREILASPVVPLLTPRIKTLSEINPLQIANLTALISVKTKKVSSLLKSLRT